MTASLLQEEEKKVGYEDGGRRGGGVGGSVGVVTGAEGRAAYEYEKTAREMESRRNKRKGKGW